MAPAAQVASRHAFVAMSRTTQLTQAINYRNYCFRTSIHPKNTVKSMDILVRAFGPRGKHVFAKASSSDDVDSGIEVDISVTGMMCDGCTSRIEEELGKMDSVASVKADLETNTVCVGLSVDNFQDAASIMEKLVDEINGMGFEAKPNL